HTRMASKQRCPKCNQLNDPGSTRCINCNTSLVQTCATCGRTRPWYVPLCANCAALAEDEAAAFTRLFQPSTPRILQGHYVVTDTLSS
ncbi:MAG: hypothetical protein GX557_05140, partial [Chloroflexi bacterium]|nr:hypothetical protein [Chloroflexota bacterium]